MITTIIISFIILLLIVILIFNIVKSQHNSKFIPRDERIYFNKFHNLHSKNKVSDKDNLKTHVHDH